MKILKHRFGGAFIMPPLGLIGDSATDQAGSTPAGGTTIRPFGISGRKNERRYQRTEPR